MLHKNGNETTAVQKSKLSVWQKIYRYRVLLLMCIPAVLFFLAFCYAPLPGLYVAFVKFNYRDGIFGSQFVGLKNFEFLATSGKLSGKPAGGICGNSSE